jgi:hypothetical protein
MAHFVPIRLQTWPPQTIIVSDWLISKKNSPVSFHLAKPFQRRRFLEINQSVTRIACGGHIC